MVNFLSALSGYSSFSPYISNTTRSIGVGVPFSVDGGQYTPETPLPVALSGLADPYANAFPIIPEFYNNESYTSKGVAGLVSNAYAKTNKFIAAKVAGAAVGGIIDLKG